MVLGIAFVRWKEELAHQKLHQKRVEIIITKVLRRLTCAKMVGTFDLCLQFSEGQTVG